MSPVVAAKNRHGEREAETLATSLAGIEESSSRVLDELLPRLLESTDGETVTNLLHDIGEELRHVIYHARDPDRWRYLFDDAE
jgi:hypothetical protein